MNHNKRYELLALKKIIAAKNPVHYSSVSPELFANKDLNNIFRLLRVTYAEKSEKLGFEALKAELAHRITSPEKREFLVDLVTTMEELEDSDTSLEFVLEKLSEQLKFRIIVDGTSNLLEMVSGRDAAAAIGTLTSLLDRLNNSDSSASVEDGDMYTMAGEEIKFNFYKTGFPPLDRRGGLIEGGLTLIAGDTGTGKSTKSQNIMQHCFWNYEASCAYFTYEQSKSEIRARILAAESGIDVGCISSGQMTLEQRNCVRVAEINFLMLAAKSDILKFVKDREGETDLNFWTEAKGYFTPRPNRFYVYDGRLDWDGLFSRMALLKATKGIKFFCVDYPYLVPRGTADKGLQQWEYALLKTQQLKSFCGQNGYSQMIAPAQYNAKEDTLRYVKGAVNAADLYIKMSVEEGDDQLGTMGATTCTFGKYRNFLTIPDEPTLLPYKLIKEFDKSRFVFLEF